jgi:hypothetical protein
MRSPHLGACRSDERLELILTPIFMFDQLSPIRGAWYRADGPEHSIGQGDKLRVSGNQLHPEPGVISCGTQAVRFLPRGKILRAAGIILLAEP